MKSNKIIVVILSICVIIVGALSISIPKVLDRPTYQEHQEFTAQHEDFMTQASEVKAELDILDKELDKQIAEMEKLVAELEEYKQLEDSIVTVILEEGYPKPTEDYARKLAKLIIGINREYSETYGFEEDIPKMMSIIRVESVFDTNIVSSAGAKGLMQLMDGTGRPIAKKLGYSNYNPFDPEQNIRVAWYYYNTDKERLGEDKATVAYNQGYRNLTGAVSRSMSSRKSYWSKIKTFDDKYSTYLEENSNKN